MSVHLEQLCNIALHAGILLVGEQEPVEFACLTPLTFLAEFLAHEEELLAAVAHHEGIAQTKVGVLVDTIAGHLLDHGTLEVNDLVVGQRENIVLCTVVTHGKGQSIVVTLAHNGIEFHILAEVMHPAHVPLEVKAKPVVFGLRGDLGPCCGFLGDGKEAGMCAMNDGIEMLEELDRVEVLISAVLVGQPLAVLLAVVKIEHGSNCIDTNTVNVEFPDPVENIRDQEIADLMLAEIENTGAPVRVLTAAGIRIFKNALAVKLRQAMRIRAEVRRHPVQNDADSGIVQLVDHVHEVVRCAIAGCRCIIASNLVAP